MFVRGSNSDTYSHHGSRPGSRQMKDIHIHTRLSMSLSPPSVHKREKKAHTAVHQQCQTVCRLRCPTKLDWRKKKKKKTVLHFAIGWLPTHAVLFYISRQVGMNISWIQILQWERLRRILCRILCFISPDRSFVLRIRKIILPLMLTFLRLYLPYLWADWASLGQRERLELTVYCHDQCTCLQRIQFCLPAPTRAPPFHASFCHHSFVPFDLSLCASCSVSLCNLLPHFSVCLPLSCCIIYSVEMPKIACHYLL